MAQDITAMRSWRNLELWWENRGRASEDQIGISDRSMDMANVPVLLRARVVRKDHLRLWSYARKSLPCNTKPAMTALEEPFRGGKEMYNLPFGNSIWGNKRIHITTVELSGSRKTGLLLNAAKH